MLNKKRVAILKMFWVVEDSLYYLGFKKVGDKIESLEDWTYSKLYQYKWFRA